MRSQRKPRRRIAQVLAELAQPRRQRPRAILTPEQQAQVDAKFARLQASQPLYGLRAALRRGGITTAVLRGSYASSAFGHWLHGHHGGNAVRAHRYLRGRDGRSWAPYLRPEGSDPPPNSAS